MQSVEGNLLFHSTVKEQLVMWIIQQSSHCTLKYSCTLSQLIPVSPSQEDASLCCQSNYCCSHVLIQVSQSVFEEDAGRDLYVTLLNYRIACGHRRSQKLARIHLFRNKSRSLLFELVTRLQIWPPEGREANSSMFLAVSQHTVDLH